ncbi:uncharacterized protein LOC135845808 [Planococcus citri]|uniref:uncharacterized protein LOC135845808 n=1 Tax=Planococcus citri TaxID=170843 RepID=UPI0031F73CED
MGYAPGELRSLAAKSSCIQLVYEWASSEILAINTWEKEEDYDTCSDHDWFIRQMNEMQLPGSSVIPNVVRYQIESRIMSILNQVSDWICYHHRKNFFHDEPASPLKEYLLKLIWKPDRSIDYEATARNVLAGSNFNAMEKYRFACTYCFPEEVWNLRDTAKVAIDWCFETEPLLVYWSKYLANQLHTITLPARYASIEEIMFAKALKEYDLWQPVKYFFEKSNSSARLSQCKKVVSHKYGKYQKKLLALLNECEKSSVYLANLKKIIRNYDENYDFEGILQVYTELKGKLSFKNFALMISQLAYWSIVDNAVLPLLMEIWNDASDEYKRLVALTGWRSRIATRLWHFIMGEGVDRYFNGRGKFRNHFVFIRALAEVYEPRNFLTENFVWLAVLQPFASVVELINEFQANSEDVEELKKDIRQWDIMKSILTLYLKFGEFDEFSSLVSFCYSDNNAIGIAFQRKFLINNLYALNFAFERIKIDWKIIYGFVNNMFRDTVEGLASYYTTKLMQYVLEKSMDVVMEMMYREGANRTVECIETFVPHHDDLARAKEICIDSLFEYLHNHHRGYFFKEAHFEKMLIWCYGSETGVAEFKEKINVSKVFINLLERWVDRYAYTFNVSDCISMEEFLHWYYPIESERKAFKLKMIYSYAEFEKIEALLKERKYRERSRMLNWFFDKDDHKIKEFNRICTCKFVKTVIYD